MSAATQAMAPSRWTSSLVALGVGLVALFALFSPEVVAAFRVWSVSTAFGHCFLVIPIAAWLAWERRHSLRGLAPRPVPPGALLMLPCIAVWLAAERLGLMEGRQLAVIAMVWVLAFTVLGPSVTRAMAIPLAYLVFLVPFGTFLVPVLQDFTARFINVGLEVLGIPHFVDSISIEIPEGRFLVAEACAGLRFLIAALAFGALYAASIYRSTGRRLAFLAASIVVPILANGIRALGIVVLGHLLGSAQAGAVDHVLYGWLFFSVVIMLLVLLGLPFREDRVDDMPREAVAPGRIFPRPIPSGFAAAMLGALAIGCLGPASSWALDRRARAEMPSTASAAALLDRLAPPPGCRILPGNGSQRSFACGAAEVHANARVFGPHASPGMVLAETRATESLTDAEDVQHGSLAQDGGAWRIDRTNQPEAATAVAVWIGGRPSPGGLAGRVALGWASLAGGPNAPVVATVTASGRGAEAATRDVAQRFGAAIIQSGADTPG